MYYFGTQMLNEAEILRIDLWHTPENARVYFLDGDKLVLDVDATLEARQFAEGGRRLLRIEDEAAELELARDKFWLAHDQDTLKQRSHKKRVVGGRHG